MSITIYASDKTTLKYTLKAMQTSRLHQSLNGECTFDFTIPGKYIPNIAVGDEVRYGDLYFNVVRVSKQTLPGVGVSVGVSCEHISYTLADTLQTTAHYSGTVSTVLGQILSGTGFSVGTVDISGTYSVTINNDTNKRSALQEWAAVTGAEIDYTQRAINFRARIGSSTAVNLSDAENVASLSVTLDSRSDTQSYDITLSRLQTLSLGDAVTIQYTSLNLNTSTRVISLDYDPFHPWTISMVTGNFVPNFTGAVSSALEARIKEGQPYYGVTIDRENGIKIERSDGASQALFNSDLFTMRALINGVMKDRIYFDPIKGDYVFDGALGADAVFTDSLYAEQGDIAELTVDRLSTSRRVRLYNLQNTGDDNYLEIQDNYLRLITGTVIYSGSTPLTEQATNRYGQGLYWSEIPYSINAQGYPLDEDGNQIYATTDEPVPGEGETLDQYKVMVYQYTELTKAELAFINESDTYVPMLVMGAGDNNGRTKGILHKAADGFDITFEDTAGESLGLKMNSAGYMDLYGLRKPTELDFSGWDYGYFSEELDGSITGSYLVDFDGSGRPVKFTDGDGHETDVVW
jgi:hypothetical protein